MTANETGSEDGRGTSNYGLGYLPLEAELDSIGISETKQNERSWLIALRTIDRHGLQDGESSLYEELTNLPGPK